MPFHRILRLGLINVAVALTAVPINGVLNRVMISELNLPASLVALLIVLPYLFSPMQVWIGGYADTHPLFGMRRTPYIVIGLLLCAGGSALSPMAAFMLAEGWHSGAFMPGLLLAILAFGAWGMGFNFATVSYLSLATEMAGEEHRARTIGIMWFMLIVAMIMAGIVIARSLREYSEAALFQAFYITCAVSLVLGFVGLFRLEQHNAISQALPARRSYTEMMQAIVTNSQARLFFGYLILLLIAILGQDILLEPYAADLLSVPIDQTTRYTSIWGTALLLGLLLTDPIVRRSSKMRVAAIGGVLVGIGLVLIAASGMLSIKAMLVPSLVVFGFGSGISTASNLALMLDMTIPGQVGIFVGAWGLADALARLIGTLLSGTLRDVVFWLTNSKASGYVTVFLVEAAAIFISLAILPRLSVSRFREQADHSTDVVGLAGELGG